MIDHNPTICDIWLIIWEHRVAIFKATFSVQKIIKKNTQMTTLYTNWSL